MATELRKLQDRHGTSSQWAASSEALLLGEVGYDTDLKRRKTGDGTTLWASLPWDDTKVNGVTVTGTPTAGQVPTATSGTAATWQTPSGGGGAVASVVGQTGAVTGTQILADTAVTAALAAKLPTSGTAADSTKVGGVTISGTPTAGQVPTATNGTTAAWSTPAAGAGDATTGAKGVIQLGGDLAGTAAAPVVAKLNGVAVSGTPTAGQVPTASNGTTAAWATPASSAPADGTITSAKLASQVPGDLAGNAAFTGTYAPLAVAGRVLSDVAATATANGALVAGKHNPVDASGGARAMTLANAASAGTVTTVEKTDASTNAVTVTLNLRGTANATLTLPWQNEAIELLGKADGSWWPVAGHKTKSSLDAAYGPGPGSDAWLKVHAGGNLDALIVGTITRDTNGAATGASVVWPDGTSGTYTATTVSSAFPGAVDAFTVTWAGGATKTVTQPAVTRDPTTGAVTLRPAMTVS